MPEIAIDVTDLLNRHCALEQEALASLSPSVYGDALPRWVYAQERTPYWMNRIVTMEPELAYDADAGEEATVEVLTVEMQLVYAPIQSGMDGEVEAALNVALPQMVAYFRRRAWLQTSAYSEPMPYLRSAVITLASGATPLPATPDGGQRIGLLFRSRCEFITPLDQEYLGDAP